MPLFNVYGLTYNNKKEAIIPVSNPLTIGNISVAIPLCFYLFAQTISLARVWTGKRRKLFLKWAIVLLDFGLIAQGYFILVRWIASKHFPVVGLFEALYFFSFCLALSYFYLYFQMPVYEAGLDLLLGLSLLTLFPTWWLNKPIVPLTPFLDTPLFFLHVMFSFAAYALFSAAACLGIWYLIDRRDTILLWLEHSIALGFYLFTLCMAAGAVWAYLAWESYWMWNLKGLWSFGLWLFYAGMVHYPYLELQEMSGQKRALFSILGFLLMIFTFLGLGLLMRGTHQF